MAHTVEVKPVAETKIFPVSHDALEEPAPSSLPTGIVAHFSPGPPYAIAFKVSYQLTERGSIRLAKEIAARLGVVPDDNVALLPFG
jgi:hypothetical protein